MEHRIAALISTMIIYPVSAAAQTSPPVELDHRPSESTSLERVSLSPSERMSITVGARLVGQYISRGVAFSDKPSFQPYVTLRATVPELTNETVTDVSLFGGVWNSMQFRDPGLGQSSSGSFSGWYEADFYVGASLQLNDSFTISGTYFRYESPSNSFSGYNDLELILAYDDSALWGESVSGFSLAPALRMVQEAGRPGRKDALYVQPSLNPGVDIRGTDGRIRISAPLVLGFSDHYYRNAEGNDVTFGFFRTGLTVAAGNFPRVRGLTVTGGFDLWLLNDEVANGLGRAKFVGRLGVTLAL